MSIKRLYRKPLVLLSLALLIVAVAGVSWGAWIAGRNRERDEILRQRFEKIAASRGVTIVDEPLLVLRGHTRPVKQVAFSPAGMRIASASSDHSAQVWDASTGQQVATFTGHVDHVWRVAFSPDGKRVASIGSDGVARVWDAGTGRELVVFRAGGGEGHAVAFSPDGKRLATCGGDNTVKVWKMPD
jgi:WD40 repeat protein